MAAAAAARRPRDAALEAVFPWIFEIPEHFEFFENYFFNLKAQLPPVKHQDRRWCRIPMTWGGARVQWHALSFATL